METRCLGPAKRGSLHPRHGRTISPASERVLDCGEVVERDFCLPPCGDHSVAVSRRQGFDPELGFPSFAETRGRWGGLYLAFLQARKAWCTERYASIREVKKKACRTKKVVRANAASFDITSELFTA